MSKKLWRIYVNYGEGYGWVPVNWSPIFDTEEEANEWMNKDYDWESPVRVDWFEVDEDEENE